MAHMGVLLAVSALTISCGAAISGTPLRADGTTDVPTTTDSSSAPGSTHQITEPPSPSDEETSAPSTSADGDSADTAALQRFYRQDLQWGACEPFVVTEADLSAYSNPKIECSRLTVPLDYSQPDGDTINIAVVRQRATGDRIGSVVFNPGGPGASGVSIVATLAQYGISPGLAERFDFVGFDPRGVGASEPYIACQPDEQRDRNRASNWPGFMPSSTPQEVAAANAASEKFVADCVSTISQQGVDGLAFLAQVGTTSVAKDLDVLREVLGDEKLTYVGWSYGTSIGTAYAEQFPGSVRAMLLDGAVDPTVDAATDSLQQTRAFQQAFDNFADWCAQQSGCLWSDPSQAVERFQAFSQPLMDRPLAVADGRALSFLDAVTGVASALYSDYSWPTLRSALADAADGDGSALMALADDYYNRDSSGHYSHLLEAFTAIRCMDSDRITDPDAVIEVNRRLVEASPFQDNGEPAAAIFDTCAFWPVEPTMLPHTPDPTGLAPVLVVSTTADPATPYEAGVELADDLGGRLLTVEGTRHTAYMLSGLGCVDDFGDDYLINLTLPPDGATCS